MRMKRRRSSRICLPALQRVVPTTATSHPFSMDRLKRRGRRRRGRMKRRWRVVVQMGTGKSCLLEFWDTWLTICPTAFHRTLALDAFWPTLITGCSPFSTRAYKEKFTSLLPEGEQATRMQKYQKALVDKLVGQFRADKASGRGSLDNQGQEARETHTRCDRGRGMLSKVWDSFIRPSKPTGPEAQGSLSRREKFWKMVKEYLSDRTSVLRDSSVPYNYWVS
ncbi:hypothetical protein PRIEUP_LOCUS1553 [Pristimantis euphronides]